MAFDVTGVLAKAAQVTQEVKESNYQNNYKLIYPQEGTIKVRLLFNNASGAVLRRISRHKINGKQIPCLREYDNHECPVCKVLNDIENAKGMDLWQLKRSTRGIAYAEYVESNYFWNKAEDEPKPGEVVILMFPWTVYSELNQLISSAGENIYSLIASNEGGLFTIERRVENSQVKYRAAIDPFVHNHKTRATEEEYEKLIMELPSLNSQFMPAELTDKEVKSASLAAEELTRTYLVNTAQATSGSSLEQQANYSPVQNAQPQVVQQVAQPQVVQNVAQPQVPQGNYYKDPVTGTEYLMSAAGNWIPKSSEVQQVAQPTVVHQQPAAQLQVVQPVVQAVAQPSTNIPNNAPQCYGSHGSADIDPNACLLCPVEVQCMDTHNS